MNTRIKVLGHPVHPMLVAYPIAFYSATLVGFIIYTANGDPFWFKAAYAANLSGLILAGVAAVIGVVDWLGLPRDGRAWSRGLTHMLLNVGGAVAFLVTHFAYLNKWSTPPSSVTVGIIFAIIGMGFTIIGGYYGFALVQSDHVGIHLTPEQQQADMSVGRR